MTVLPDKFHAIKPTRCTNFSDLFLEWNSTCFRQFLCPSSVVFHCTHSNGICHISLLTACEQDQDGNAFHPDPACRVPAGWGSQILRQSAHESGKIVSPTHRPPLLLRKYSWYSFLLEAESTPGAIMRAGRIMSMKNSNDTIGNQTRDLRTCSAVPQQTAPPAACPHVCHYFLYITLINRIAIYYYISSSSSSSSSSCSGRIRRVSCSLYPQNETGPSISSSVVLCVFVLLVYIVVLV